MAEYHRVAAVADVPPGMGTECTAGGRMIALYNVDGEFYALDGVCPHAGGPLGKGVLDGQIVTCPWHGWQFDVTSGHHCLNDALQHPQFDVKVDGDDVLVAIP